jgi:hypothetical protein
MEQNYFWRDNNSLGSKECPSFLWNWTVNYHMHTQVTQIHFNINLSKTTFPTWSLLFRFFEESVAGVTHFSCVSNLSVPYHLFRFISMIYGDQQSLWILLLCSFFVSLPLTAHIFLPSALKHLKECYTIWKRPLFSPIKCMIFTKKIKLVTIGYLNNRGSNNLWYYFIVVVH